MLKGLKDSILSWFYTTYVGGLYFDLLLWVDRRFNTTTRYLTPKEMAQIVRESSQVTEGVNIIKQKVNKLVASKSKEEYDKVLSEIDNMVSYAEREWNSDRAKFADILRQVHVKKGNIDIVTDTDKAKMVDQRIQDMYQLHDHIDKRNLLRGIRSARSQGDTNKACKLEQEFLKKYGRSNSRLR
jgi:uncharacterized protein (UPF0264 family)